ncbi:MAG: diguanylate cyclase [Xanthomonadales bacterium]|nr:diguanylate cyclase [Xanthomonadales bacterium]
MRRLPGRLLRWGWWLFVLGWASAMAQPVRPIDGYYRESWSQRDGLPHSLINAIAQTPDGYLWLATWEGAARYNGREFVVFDRESVAEMSDHGFRAMTVSRDGSLWVGASRGGVMRMHDGVWTRLDREDGLAQDEIMALGEGPGDVMWVAYESAGVGAVAPDGSIRHFNRDDGLPSDVMYALAVDQTGRIWLGTAEGLGYIDAEGRAGTLKLSADDSRHSVYSVHAAPGWPLLLGTDRGVFEVEGGVVRKLDVGLPLDTVQRVYRDRAGQIWVGTVNFGVFRLSSLGLENIDAKLGLPNNRVASIFEDREGSVWVGTNGGLFRLRDAPFSSMTTDHGLSDNYVRTVIEHSDGSLWIGSSAGLTHVRDKARPVSTDGLDRVSVLSLHESADGSVWVGTYSQGVWRVRGEELAQRIDTSHGLVSNQVRALLEDRDGTLWVGTNRGLSRVRASGVRTFTAEDGLPRDFIIALFRDRAGVLWVGTANGLARLGENERFETVDIERSANAQDVFGFAEDEDGALWLATDRGLARWYRNRLTRLGRPDGLPIDTLFQVVIDRIGNIWLTSNRGVMRMSHADAVRAMDLPGTHVQVELFNELDGMASAQCNGGSGPAAVLRRNGEVSVGTSMGLASIQPQRLGEFGRHVPPIVIESFLVDDRGFPVESGQVLAAGTRRIEMHFAGLSYLMPQKIVYRYRLDGFDDRWFERGTQRHAQFTNLPPGEYTFRVTAANRGGSWNAQEAELRFEIRPFLWQRKEFWVLVAALVFLLVGAAIRLRLRQLGHAKEQLEHLVAERTADLEAKTQRLQEADHEKSALLEQIRTQSEAFERQAREDALTGLFNRRAFDEAMSREFARARRTGASLSLVLLDIDWFKRINDTYSHAAGDEALRRVAAALQRTSRDMDVVSRYGGEEFAVLCPETHLDKAVQFAERLRQAVESIDSATFAPGLELSVSLGVAEATGLSHHERLVSRADAALYRAKEGGRNRVCI